MIFFLFILLMVFNLIFGVWAEASYSIYDGEIYNSLWDVEPMIFMIGLALAIGLVFKWYGDVKGFWLKDGHRRVINFLYSLPVWVFFIVLYAVTSYETPDVTESVYYITMYTSAGIVFVFLHSLFFERMLDISPVYDCLHRNNTAAIAPVCGGFLSAAVMYAFMNMGDGDGWWCVFVPYFMCWGLWLILAAIVCAATDVAERITVDRRGDVGLRFGAYLFFSGLIIAVYNIGDYINFGDTLLVFVKCWPVLGLTAIYIITERIFANFDEKISGIANIAVVLLYAFISYFILKFSPAIPWSIVNGILG